MHKFLKLILYIGVISFTLPLNRYVPGIFTGTVLILLLSIVLTFAKIETKNLFLYICFLLYLFFNWALLGQSDRGWADLSKFTLIIALIIVLEYYVKTSSDLYKVTKVWIIGVVLNTFLGIYETLNGIYIAKMAERFEYFSDTAIRYIPYDFEPNYMQINLAWALILSFYYFKKFKGNKSILYFISFCIVVLEYFLTVSKAAFLTIALLFPIYILSGLKNTKVRLYSIAITVLVGIFLFNYEIDFSFFDYNIERYSDLFSADTTKIMTHRDRLFAKALDFFLDNPIFGYGVGNVTEYMSSSFGNGMGTTHNTFLHMLAETGLVGFLFYIVLIFSFSGIKLNRKLNPYQIACLVTFIPLSNVTATYSVVFWMLLILTSISVKLEHDV